MRRPNHSGQPGRNAGAPRPNISSWPEHMQQGEPSSGDGGGCIEVHRKR